MSGSSARAEVEAATDDLPKHRLVDAAKIINMQAEPQRSAFVAYRVAFRANEAEPNLPHAAALVCAWNDLARIMGLDPV